MNRQTIAHNYLRSPLGSSKIQQVVNFLFTIGVLTDERRRTDYDCDENGICTIYMDVDVNDPIQQQQIERFIQDLGLTVHNVQFIEDDMNMANIEISE